MNTLFQLGVNLSKGVRDEDKDIARVLARKDNPQTSKDAAEKIVKSGELNRQEDEVFYIIKLYSPSTFTTKDIAVRMLGYPYYKAYDICRKRFSGLRNKGKIKLVYEDKGKPINRIVKRRDGCRIWRLKNENY